MLAIVISTSQARILRHRMVKGFPQHHTAEDWQPLGRNSRESNSRVSSSKTRAWCVSGVQGTHGTVLRYSEEQQDLPFKIRPHRGLVVYSDTEQGMMGLEAFRTQAAQRLNYF